MQLAKFHKGGEQAEETPNFHNEHFISMGLVHLVNRFDQNSETEEIRRTNYYRLSEFRIPR